MTPEAFDVLAHRYFEASLSSDEEKLLWERIRTDPAAADRFVELGELESGMVEALQAQEEMPTGVYALVHGTRRRHRTLRRAARPRPVWPYWAASALFLAALGLLLRTESGRSVAPEPPPNEPVAEFPRTPPPQSERAIPEAEASPVPSVRGVLEAERTRRQAVLRETVRTQQILEEARKEARSEQKPEAERELDRGLAQAESERKEEATQLAKVEEALRRPEPTRVGAGTEPGVILERVEGEVEWIREKPRRAEVGQAVVAGGGLETRGAKSLAVLKFEDGTRLELKPGSRLENVEVEKDKRRFTLSQGMLLASVTRQKSPRSLVFLTPHAEVTVLGTRFSLQVIGEGSRLEVEEGHVANRRLSDGKTVEVTSNHSVVTGRSGPLVARPIPRVQSFQDGVLPSPDYAGTRDTSIDLASPQATSGSADLLRLQRQTSGEHHNIVLLRWDVSSIPARSRILSGELAFWVTGSIVAPGARAFEIRRPWEESEATWRLARAGSPWQMAGARGEQDGGTKTLASILPGAPGWSVFPLTEAGVALLQQWVSAPGSNFGIGISKEPPNAWDLASREWANPEHRPMLSVTYLPPEK